MKLISGNDTKESKSVVAIQPKAEFLTVFQAADRLGIAMVFTGIRHFRHYPTKV